MDVLKRLEQRIAASSGVDKAVMIEAVREISRMRRDLKSHHGDWFYLACHPEDVRAITDHRIYGVPYEVDAFGHVINDPDSHKPQLDTPAVGKYLHT